MKICCYDDERFVVLRVRFRRHGPPMRIRCYGDERLVVLRVLFGAMALE